VAEKEGQGRIKHASLRLVGDPCTPAIAGDGQEEEIDDGIEEEEKEEE